MELTVQYLYTAFNKYNNLFFNGVLPNIEIKISRTRNSFGRFWHRTDLRTGIETPLHIDISKYYKRSQHDIDTTVLGDAPGLISGINVVEIPASRELSLLAMNTALDQGTPCARGIIASGDQFISNSERKDFIRTTFGAIACEMEGAAIGHACYLSGVDFVIIRCISDSATGDAEMEYPEMVSRAAVKSEALVLAMLSAMED